MKYNIVIQNPEDYDQLPEAFVINRWAQECLKRFKSSAEVTIRFVSNEEIQSLNQQFRQKDKPTNVLSFPFDSEGVPADIDFIGDIVIAPKVIEQEAQEQEKPLEAHYAHMIIHGLLHLLGYDHIKQEDADVMEPLEIELLATFNIPNPYEA